MEWTTVLQVWGYPKASELAPVLEEIELDPSAYRYPWELAKDLRGLIKPKQRLIYVRGEWRPLEWYDPIVDFFKWLWDNQANPKHCQKVPITPDPNREFAEFPDDPDLSGFDRKDRKFVAVALASGLDPEVLNATDKGWYYYSAALKRNGVRVQFLCPDAMPGPS